MRRVSQHRQVFRRVGAFRTTNPGVSVALLNRPSPAPIGNLIKHRRCLSIIPTTSTSPDRPEPRKNEDLETVKNLGLEQLQETTREVAEKSSKPLFQDNQDVDATPDQISEARRIMAVTQEALNQFTMKNPTFTIRGDPIEILDVEVSRDLRQARVYWTLPFWMMDYPAEVTNRATEKMQAILDRRGGRLQTLVQARLRHYYPPKLKFVAADGDLLRLALQGII